LDTENREQQFYNPRCLYIDVMREGRGYIFFYIFNCTMVFEQERMIVEKNKLNFKYRVFF